MTWLASPPHTRLAELRSRLRTLPEEHVVDLSRDVHGFATAWPVSWLIIIYHQNECGEEQCCS